MEQARVWRRRHGGTLARLFPFGAAARWGLETLVPQMPKFLDYARQLAEALRDIPGVTVIPDPPQTPLFHVHLHGDRDLVWRRALDVAQERRVWLFNPPQPTLLPGVSKVELDIGEPALEILAAEAAEMFAAVAATDKQVAEHVDRPGWS